MRLTVYKPTQKQILASLFLIYKLISQYAETPPMPSSAQIIYGNIRRNSHIISGFYIHCMSRKVERK